MTGASAILLGLVAVLSGPPAARAIEVATDLRVDRIEISGVTALTSSEVESTLEVALGEVVDRQKIVQSIDGLKTLYRNKGYESASVRAQMARQRGESVLALSVDEGLPTRVARIDFSAGEVRPDFDAERWSHLIRDLESRTREWVHGVHELERVSAVSRLIKEVLGAEDYVGVRIEEAVRPTSDPSDSAAPAAARWVDLEFKIHPGERITFGFRGNEVLGEGELQTAVKETRMLGAGRDFIGGLKRRIEEEYRALGYFNVSVTPFTFESQGRPGRHVTFEIKEGAKVALGEIAFDGNIDFSDHRLREQFLQSSSKLVRRGFYSAKDVELGAENLIEWIRSQGYLSAKLVTVGAKRSRERRDTMDLTIYVYEGEQTLVESVQIKGAREFTSDEISAVLRVEPGAPLNLFAFTAGIEELKALYRERGFFNVSIANEGSDSVVLYSEENRIASIRLEIVEGPKFRIGAIEIEVSGEVRPEVVRREIRFLEGDLLEEHLLADTESRLRKLGLFSSVVVRAVDDPQAPDRKIVRVAVEEGTPGVLGGGVGLRNDLGIRLFGQVGYANLWRWRHSVALDVSINRRFENFHFAEYQFQLGYVWPWVFLGETVFKPTVSAEKTQYRGFDVSANSLSLGLERRLLDEIDLRSGIAYSLESINQFGAKDPKDNGPLRIGGVTPSLRLDLRDDPLAPSRGLFASSSMEIASPFLLSQSHLGFYRFQARTDYYVPVADDVVWQFSVRLGHEGSTERPVSCEGQGTDCVPDRENDRTGSIPLIKQFTLGGVGSIRGFEEQEINVYDLQVVYGTLSYVNYRTQLDFPLAKPLFMGLFLDAGNLSVDRFTLGNLRYGVGTGLHYSTPVGLVNLDVGFKLRPQPDEDSYRFYFSVGVL